MPFERASDDPRSVAVRIFDVDFPGSIIRASSVLIPGQENQLCRAVSSVRRKGVAGERGEGRRGGFETAPPESYAEMDMTREPIALRARGARD